MSTQQRAILLFTEDTDAADDLRHILLFAAGPPPWKPNPESVRYGSPQMRYTQEETDQMILDMLHRAASKISWGGNVIVP